MFHLLYHRSFIFAHHISAPVYKTFFAIILLVTTCPPKCSLPERRILVLVSVSNAFVFLCCVIPVPL